MWTEGAVAPSASRLSTLVVTRVEMLSDVIVEEHGLVARAIVKLSVAS